MSVGDIVHVDSSEFTASPEPTGRLVECVVSHFNDVGQVFVIPVAPVSGKFVSLGRCKWVGKERG